MGIRIKIPTLQVVPAGDSGESLLVEIDPNRASALRLQQRARL